MTIRDLGDLKEALGEAPLVKFEPSARDGQNIAVELQIGQRNRETKIGRQEWHSLDPKQSAAVDFVAARTEPASKFARELDPLRGKEMPVSQKAAIIFDGPAYQGLLDLENRWYSHNPPVEAVLINWGDHEVAQINGKTVYLVQEVTDGTKEQGAGTVTVDVDRVNRQVRERGRASWNQELNGIYHLHPVGCQGGLPQKYEGTFSSIVHGIDAGDAPSVIHQSLNQDGTVNPLLVGVVSRSYANPGMPLAVGSYTWNPEQGRTTIGNQTFSGQIEKLPGYYLIIDEDLVWINFLNAGDNIQMTRIARYNDADQKWLATDANGNLLASPAPESEEPLRVVHGDVLPPPRPAPSPQEPPKPKIVIDPQPDILRSKPRDEHVPPERLPTTTVVPSRPSGQGKSWVEPDPGRRYPK
ncbi:MAG: hypothetical protein WC686_03830 [Candidatus Shapirobacteria bacterium]|jgi:hypothetical protein